MTRKLPFPDFMLNTPAEVTLNQEGLSEDGSPLPSVRWSGRVIYSEKSRTTMTPEGRLVRLEGSVIIKGDIAPDMVSLADGGVTVGGKTYTVYRGARPRNPDGTVHHTTLELM